MNKCFIQLADIDEAQLGADTDNVGGIVHKFIYGYWDEVATWPDKPSSDDKDSLTLEEAGFLEGDVVMKAGKRAYEFAFTDDSGEVSITDQGELGGESCRYELTVGRAKMTPTVMGFENAVRGRRMFFIAKDRNGYCYLLGDKLVPARKITGDASTTGKAASELNQTPLKFAYDAPRKLMYKGDTTALLTAAGE